MYWFQPDGVGPLPPAVSRAGYAGRAAAALRLPGHRRSRGRCEGGVFRHGRLHRRRHRLSVHPDEVAASRGPAEFLPTLPSPAACMYTDHAGRAFVIARHPDHERVTVAAASPATASSSCRWSARSWPTWRRRRDGPPGRAFEPRRPGPGAEPRGRRQCRSWQDPPVDARAPDGGRQERRRADQWGDPAGGGQVQAPRAVDRVVELALERLGPGVVVGRDLRRARPAEGEPDVPVVGAQVLVEDALAHDEQAADQGTVGYRAARRRSARPPAASARRRRARAPRGCDGRRRAGRARWPSGPSGRRRNGSGIWARAGFVMRESWPPECAGNRLSTGESAAHRPMGR